MCVCAHKGGFERTSPHLVLPGHRSIVNQTRYSSVNRILVTSGVEKIVKVGLELDIFCGRGGWVWLYKTFRELEASLFRMSLNLWRAEEFIIYAMFSSTTAPFIATQWHFFLLHECIVQGSSQSVKEGVHHPASLCAISI